VIEPGERAVTAGVMRLVSPRREVDIVDLTDDPDDIRRMIVESVHSRLPVHAGTPEEMLGVVQAKDLLDACLRGERLDIRAQLNVPDTADALDVVDVIKASPVYMALVHDEYGHFQGVRLQLDSRDQARRLPAHGPARPSAYGSPRAEATTGRLAFR
jgi:magnesium and cobalt exporter, CNNM family